MMMIEPKKMVNAGEVVTLCIGGQTFVTRRATLYRLPESRLYMIASQEREDNENPVFFFDRDPEIFRFVLDYYRTGELHLPSSICGPFVRKELIFWGIDESFILPCCMPAYMRYEEERRTKKTLFKDCFEDIDSMKNLVKCCRGFKRIRYMMWLFLDHPSSSLPAKIWAMTLLFLMIGSVMCYCLSTNINFRHKSLKLTLSNSSSLCNEEDVRQNAKLNRDCTTEPIRALVYVDVSLNSLFTAEFILKVLLAPDKKKFLRNFVSILDIVILSSFWLHISLFYHYYYFDSDPTVNANDASISLWLLNMLTMTQSMRILRIFKISKISRGLRVLMLTVKKSIPELVLLGFLLMNGMFLFSSLIYMAEYTVNDTFQDIPHAFWWSIITLTTVGYGDSYPKGGPGYLIGSIAAISGCILTGLAIPIIGNNFNTYYKYMQNQLKEDKYLRQLRKDTGSAGCKDIKGVSAPNRKYIHARGDLKPNKADNHAGRAANGIYNKKKLATGATAVNTRLTTGPANASEIADLLPASAPPPTTFAGSESPVLVHNDIKSSSFSAISLHADPAPTRRGDYV